MNWSKAALGFSVVSTIGLSVGVGVALTRKDPRLAALVERADEQDRVLTSLRIQLRNTQRTADMFKAIVEAQSTAAYTSPDRAAPQAQATMQVGPSARRPVAPSPDQATRVATFLADTKISPVQWRTVQDAHETWTATAWKVAEELAGATPEEATRKLDELDRQRIAEASKTLDAAQLKAYEQFRLTGPYVGRIVCANGAVNRLLAYY